MEKSVVSHRRHTQAYTLIMLFMIDHVRRAILYWTRFAKMMDAKRPGKCALTSLRKAMTI